MKKLGDRMKEFYENRTRYQIPRRTYTIIRIDGKAFHSYTKKLIRPFDNGLINDMDETAKYLCENIQGAKLAYVQSDEISILITDFDNIDTDMWFDGNIQKMASVSASMATSKFNKLRLERTMKEEYDDLDSPVFFDYTSIKNLIGKIKIAEFDSRIFQIPTSTEVVNYFIFRQNDAKTNSVSALAQNYYSHKELQNKNTQTLQEMVRDKKIEWNELPTRKKYGGLIVKKETEITTINKNGETDIFMRNKWESVDTPVFLEKKEFLLSLFPKNE
jgi:tRNA(His) guanylyltransferase